MKNKADLLLIEENKKEVTKYSLYTFFQINIINLNPN